MGKKSFPVAIHGVPRSGTTWLGEIINSSPNVKYAYQPLFSYKLKNYLTNCSKEEEIRKFFNLILETKDEFILQNRKRNIGTLPNFTKGKITHIVYKEVRYHNILFNLVRNSTNLKFIFIIRNPLAVINSWLQAPREFRKDLNWSISEEWRYALKKNLNRPEEFNGFEKWKEAINIFLEIKKQYPDRIHIVEYSNLLSNTMQCVESLFSFLNLHIEQQTISFIDKSRSNDNDDAYSVYRTKNSDNKWKKELNEDIAKEIINDLSGTALEKYLYL